MKLLAFLKRDWSIQSSYRLNFMGRVGHVVFTTASFFFIGKLIDPQAPAVLEPYGGAYFPFVLLGLAFAQYLATSLSGFAGRIRDEQVQGTLEAMLTTPTNLLTIAIGVVAWDFLWTTVEVVMYVGVGVLAFGVDLGQLNLGASCVLLVLSILSLSSFGVLSACAILLFKEFDPVSWLLGGVMKLVSGVYFPVALLPGWLEALARVFPSTYALEGLRQVVLVGRSLGELWDVCLVLGGFAVVLWPLALVGFSWTIRRLKTTGALSFR